MKLCERCRRTWRAGPRGPRAPGPRRRAGRRAGRCAHPAQMSRETEKLLFHSKVHMQSAGRAVRKGSKAVLVRYSVRLNTQW